MSGPQPISGDVRAVVLAAGRGRRLGGITAALPKPLVPVLNRPVLTWIVEDLAASGITQVVFNLHHLASEITAWMHKVSIGGVQLVSVREDRLTGPAGGLLAVLDHLCGAECTVVVSGDACTTVDFGTVVQAHQRRGAAMTVVTQVVEDPRPFGQVEADTDGWITGMVREPTRRLPSGMISTGMYVVSPGTLTVLAGLRSTAPDLDFDRHLVPALLRRGLPVAAFETSAYWNDVGAPQALLSASLRLLGTDRLDRAALPCQDAAAYPAAEVWCEGGHPTVMGTICGRVLLGGSVRVPVGSRIEGPAVLGAGTTLAEGTVLRRSVTMPNTRLPSGRFEDAVLFGDGEKASS
jgi:NDP-sugar pyrophosphorylase family protein